MPGINTVTRQTGLLASVVDDNLNSWEDFAGTDINIDVAYQFWDIPVLDEYDQDFWQYRGQAAMCARTTDGAIVRVRIGNGTGSNRTVYQQIITDPTDPSQWEDWTQLYTGTHYAIAIQADSDAAAGYRIFHSKSDGLYVDNVLVITRADIVRIKPVGGTTGVVYYQTVQQDIDGARRFWWWYTPNINAGTPSESGDCANYRWYRSDLFAFKVGDDYYRFRSMAHDAGSRNRWASEQLTIESAESSSFNTYDNVRFLMGPSGRSGFKTMQNLFVTTMSSPPWDEAYYLFFNERHLDTEGHALSNLKNPLFWCRSIGYPYYLSQPTPVGYSIWGFAGALEWGDYIYLAGNGRVLRRPKYATEIDLTDYVLSGEYDLPRENQKAQGKLVVVNKNNVIGSQMGMTDGDESGLTERRLLFGIGQKAPDSTMYDWKREEGWRTATLRKLKEDGREHLEIGFANFWHRLENVFRDAIYLPGRMEWDDWQPEAPNAITAYQNSVDEFQSYSPAEDPAYLPQLLTIQSGNGPVGGISITKYMGWRGENASVTARLWDDGGIVFRYVDEQNFYIVTATSGGSVVVKRYEGGVPTTLASASMEGIVAPFWMTVDFRWKIIDVDINFGEVNLNPNLTDPAIFTGFVGFACGQISNFNLHEFNVAVTTKDLIRTLLTYADEHEVVLEVDEETAAAPQLDTHWGPQSDLDTPEKAFRQLIEAASLQVVWLED